MTDTHTHISYNGTFLIDIIVTGLILWTHISYNRTLIIDKLVDLAPSNRKSICLANYYLILLIWPLLKYNLLQVYTNYSMFSFTNSISSLRPRHKENSKEKKLNRVEINNCLLFFYYFINCWFHFILFKFKCFDV